MSLSVNFCPIFKILFYAESLRKLTQSQKPPGYAPCCPTRSAGSDYPYFLQGSNDKKSQREISDIAGVAEVTIKQSYRLMRDRAAELFPDDFKFATQVENLPPS